ncbi:MAG: hypothetical protein Kow0029_22220 [Candidatus Rifleibacteriota bacterium]
MKFLIIGAGMYVTGRHNTGTGTVLASLTEASKHFDIDSVVIVARNPDNDKIVRDKTAELNSLLGANLKVVYKSFECDFKAELDRELKNESYDAAIVSTPDHLHFEHTKTALENGLHVLVVKPLVPTMSEALELEKIREHNNVHAMVEFHKRFDETNLWIKKSIDRGDTGDVLFIDVDYSQKISIPTEIFRGWVDKTNIFQYLGVHYVDLIHFITGYVPVRAMGVGTLGRLKKQGIDNFDTVHAEVIWQSPGNSKPNLVSHFSIGWIDPVSTTAMSDQKYSIIGEKGRIECDQKDRGLRVVFENTGPQTINPYFSELLPDENGNFRFGGYGYKSIECFVKDVSKLKAGKTKPSELLHSRPSFKQSLISTKVVEAVNASLYNNSNWSQINDFS